MVTKILAVLTALSLAFPQSTLACCMVAEWYTGSISQKRHEALVFHHDGREELILRIDVGLTPEEKMPDEFAWIVTVPSVPDGYDASVDPAAFDDVDRLVARELRRMTKSAVFANRGAALETMEDELQIEVVQVGPYEIHQIQTVGKDAVLAMNEWLRTNGFPEEDVDHMQWFVDRGMTWLCIKYRPEAGRDAFTERTELPPLRVSFATERPYYPLKFSSRQGVFPLKIDLLTGAAVDFVASAAVLDQVRANQPRFRRNVRLAELEGDALGKLAERIREEGRLTAPPRWILNRITSPAVNTPDNPIADWRSDVYLELETG